MIKTVIVNNNGKIDEILQFEIPTEDFDLKQAIYEACLEYCKTEEGWVKYSASKVFDVNFFLTYVPDTICKKHKFWKIQKQRASMVMERCEQILTEADVENCKQHLDTENVEEYNTYEVTAWFARMWGVMETLGKLPQQDFKDAAGILVSWAEEFVKKGESDPILFFQRKMEIN